MVFRFFRREYNQIEFKILFLSALIALWMIFVITALLHGLSSDLSGRAKNLLGGSAILEAPEKIPDTFRDLTLKYNLKIADNLEFFSMAYVDEKFLLIQVSAFKNTYPLVGHIEIANKAGNDLQIKLPPPSGEAWVSDRVLADLQINLGDNIHIGNVTLKVTGLLKKFPLLLSRSNILSPLVYVNQDDIYKMGVAQEGSQINYRLIVEGDDENLKNFMSLPEVSKAGFNVTTTEKSQESISRPFRIANRYLSVILVIQTLLSGIAVAVSCHIYAKRQEKTVAVMRTLGASFWKIFYLYLGVFFFVFFAAVLAAGLLGILSIKAGVNFLTQFGLLDITIPGIAYMLTIWIGFLLIIGVALPSILSLRNTSAVEIQKQTKSTFTFLQFCIYLFISIMIVASLLGVFYEFRLPLTMLCQVILMGCVSFGMAWLFWKALFYFKNISGYTLKMALQSLLRLRKLGYTQWVIYSLVFTFLLIIEIIQYDVLPAWQQQLPEKTPNFFLVNIQEDQVPLLKQWFSTHQVASASLYPVVRGAFTHVNGQAVSSWGEGRSDPNAPAGMNRSINLTWMSVLPEDNQVIQGINWSELAPGQPLISVEENFAKQRNLKLDDELSFLVEGQSITAKIVQVRTLNWQSFKPNFFVIFPPGVLEAFPKSYIGSFYLPKIDRSLITSLTQEFIELSVIDLEAMIETMRSLVRQFSLALELVLLIMLFTGLLLIWVIMQGLLKKRLHEGALLKILGVPKGLLKKMMLIENILLGSSCGLTAAFFAQMIVHDISYEYFDIYYTIKMKWFLWGAGLGAVLLITFSSFSFRKVFYVSPLLILRKTE